jgi:Secreted and surface protein containing fasciclin-like repeats
MNTQETDIVVNAANAGNFVTLSNALKAAGLVGALKGIGPFTFFAPTDEAFRKLPPGALEQLLKDRPRLAAIINGHVIHGSVLSNDVTDGDRPSIEGPPLAFKTTGTGFTVNGAKVSRNEIEACNGVIHPIDRVLMPA